MPLLQQVDMPHGNRCHICQIVLPEGQVRNMTAQEIGEQVLRLVAEMPEPERLTCLRWLVRNRDVLPLRSPRLEDQAAATRRRVQRRAGTRFRRGWLSQWMFRHQE